ncbi:MAG: hypothetical protein LQ348_002870 [Seirophora lacunosa]|nr:MAG: hypothetical protein LQ348_002870 [Seirophora lacunosa]
MTPQLAPVTFAGLRAAQTDLGMKPTPTPELSKRLIEDPAICGWVEGNQSDPGYCAAAVADGIVHSEGRAPYCATYRYDQGSRGYGCAAITGYNRTVLTTTNPGFTPFGQPTSSSTSASSTSEAAPSPAGAAASPSSSSSDLTLISGGAIAGAVAGSVLVLAAIVGIVYFVWRRNKKKKEQERQAATVMSERRESDYVYAQYAKADASTLSPTMSPGMHSRQLSDQTYGFATSPPLSDNGRPWSPGSVCSRDGPAELAADEEDRHASKR